MGRFLLVSLKIDAILGEVTIRQRKKKLEEMTQGNGLSDAYTATLSRLKAQKGCKSALGLKVLMWVLYSERPLRAQGLCHALGVDIGSTDLDPENVPALRTIIASCLGLVTVEASSSTVRLVHFTLKEHLLRDPTLFHSPHSVIAEVCLTYLNFRSIRDLSPTPRSAPSTMPFLEYASLSWWKHARMGMTENIKLLALRLLDRFDEHISAQLLLLRYYEEPYYSGATGATGFTGLHGAAFLGIVEIAAAILDMKKWDVNAADCTGSTALIWAAMRGHSGVVKVLLQQEGINPNQIDTEYGQTLLWWAIRRRYFGVVKVLLEREDINPNQADTEHGHTPLSWAASKGYSGVVEMLLERDDINPNQADTATGTTPLFWAVKRRYEEVIAMLLGRNDVNPNQADTEYGQTPLSWAASKGHSWVVGMLVEREDINPNQADTESGQTPILWAASKGYLRVVGMLLEREDINLNQADTEYGQTPLSRAVEHGHSKVLKMLLEQENINPNQADTKYGQTPLSRAAEYGNSGAVKMLLKREDINPNLTDTGFGWTPLLWAIKRWHVVVVELLLGRKDVNPNLADTESGRTPLSLAAKHGHGGLVKMLLKREDINPNQADTENGRTPLSWAAEKGHGEVVKMLLEREDVNPNQADTENGRTPLSWAAERGHLRVVKMFLELKNVRAATPESRSQAPLSLALSQRHNGIAGAILEWDDPNPDITDGQIPSARNGDESAVEMQSRGNDSSAHTPDPDCLPAPLSADHNGREVVSDPKDSVSLSSDSDLLAKLSSRPQHPVPGLLKPHYPSKRRRLNRD